MKDNDLIRRSDVLKLQAVNAVEVVRCKDCVHWRYITDSISIPGWCDIIKNYTTSEWYCAEGYTGGDDNE